MRYTEKVTDGPLNKTLHSVEQKYSRDRNIRAVFITGSVARGTATKLSDIDLVHIVRRPRPYVRYFSGQTHIEVLSLTFEEITKHLRQQPITLFSLWELRSLYDPEHLYLIIKKLLRTWRKKFHVEPKTRGDLYITLDHIQRKIISAKKAGDNVRALFFAIVGLEPILAGFFAANNVLIPPASEMIELLPMIKKKPAHFDRSVKTIIQGSNREKIQGTLGLLNFIVPRLRPAMRYFPRNYRPL